MMVSHIAGLPESVTLFDELAKSHDITLRVVGPSYVDERGSGFPELRTVPMHRGYRVVPVPLRNPTRYNRSLYSGEYAEELRNFSPGIVHLLEEWHSSTILQTGLLSMRLPVRPIVGFYGFDNIYNPSRSIPGAVRGYLLRQMIDFGFVASRDAMSVHTMYGFPEEKLRLAYWGVPVDRFPLLDKTECRKFLGLRESGLVYGYVGRVVEEKGVMDLVRAHEICRTELSSRLVIVGDGHLKEKLSTYINDKRISDSVVCFPAVEQTDLPRFYGAIDFLVVPSRTTESWKEQYGRVIVESMACGTPVLGSSSGAIPEVVGDAGLIFREGDIDDLCMKMREMSGRRDSLRLKCSENVRTKSTKAFARALVDRYLELSG